ncbi:PREDICTED: uncharacterized protein LOC108773797 [Cyphomyrmex costatus]|uniref:uncharacterized protein LOC108773797 n=1 Tax=Cyphomyrmex costatus TaxID=456900 RepID=UPI00085224F3|nr:PREDICTED: uncharacterized protein LOC108773797 [Cyphomyrmex costatus]
MKYLGFYLDSWWSFRGHFDRILEKAENTATALSRLMRNLRCPRQRRRTLYANVVISIIMYGAPLWEDAIRADRRIRERAGKIFRRLALRVTSGYRTVSHSAAAIMSGMVPFDLRAEEYYRVYMELRTVPRVNNRVPELRRRAIKTRKHDRILDRNRRGGY